jgi:uncharacterized phage-associated protein
MLINREREKLLNAIIYFISTTKNCGKTKLFKLLYFLDFQHFEQTGRSVTGLVYQAWPKGPVPDELFHELESPEKDFEEFFSMGKLPTSKDPMLKLKAKKAFNKDLFSKRELNILQSLSKEYCISNSDEMIENTHLENMPWFRVYEIENNRGGIIPYHYALNSNQLSELKEIIEDRNQFISNYA